MASALNVLSRRQVHVGRRAGVVRPRALAAAIVATCGCLLAEPAGAIDAQRTSDSAHSSSGFGLELGQLRGSALSLQLFRRAAAEAAAARSDSASGNTTGNASGEGAAAGAEGAPKGELLAPQENDTLTVAYWSRVDEAILNASVHTPPPSSATEPPEEPGHMKDFKKVFHPSMKYRDASTPDKLPKEDQAWYNWDNALPPISDQLQSMNSDTENLRDLVLQPFDMQLGAKVMYELSRKNPSTPPPSQQKVNQQYSAQCPMVIFGNDLYIGAPACSTDLTRSLGTWEDRKGNRSVLRWQGNGAGGVRFGVDSKLSGPGSVLFAEISEIVTLDTYVFSLLNCLGTESFVVEESIIKIDHFGSGSSTATDHDLSVSSEAFFYQYIIKNPTSGEIVAETSLYRADTHQVNVTVVQQGPLEGAVVASANRVGQWADSVHSGCSWAPKGWNVTFPTEPSAFDTVATAQDLRVVATVVVTLMSFRDQDVGSDGLQHLGQANMFWSLFKSALAIIFVVFMVIACWQVCHSRGVDKKLKRILFRLEVAFLPQRPATKEWNAPIQATW